MTVTLITGGNKGLGFETARRLIAYGHNVYIGARNVERGKESADKLGAKFVRLDVTDLASARCVNALLNAVEAILEYTFNYFFFHRDPSSARCENSELTDVAASLELLTQRCWQSFLTH